MAGNIDNLNFEVILNDTKFETAVKKDIELAKKLNTSLTQVLNLKNKINATSKSAFLDEQRMAREAAKTAAAKAKEALQWQKVRTEAEKTALANQKVKAAIEKSAASLSGSGNSFLRVWLRFSATLWSIISVIRIFTNTIGQAFKKIMDFQQANANLATIMQVSRKEIETLTNDALMLGRTTEWTASQVTELQTALAKLGYNIPQIQNMQASVLQFATAVGANLPDAANLAGAALRMFGMHSSEMQKALEILTASTNKTALDFEKLKTSLPYVGAIAHSIGFDVAETAAMLGVLSNAGLSASRTGTGLRQVLLELSKQNGKLQNAMGGNIKSFDDFVNGLQAMRDRGLEAGEATKLVSTRASSALLILANGVDDIRRLNDEIRDTDGLLKSIQSERLDTLHGSVLLLKSAWEGLIQTFRDSAGPMKDIVDWLTDIVRATSLAASRANRVAQGTSGNDAKRGTSGIIGSDALSNQFKQHFDSLIKNGTSPEEAARIVNKEMNTWLDSAQDHLIELQKNGYKENAWNRFLYDNWIGRIFVGSKMNRGREANEQVEAVENAMGAVTAYMSSRAKEEAEIAANTYLEEWKFVFDTQGEQAARDAMRKVAGFDEIKSRMEAYIANGGEEGASDRGKGNDADDKQRKFISNLKDEAQYLRKLADAYEKLEPYLGEGTNAKMIELFGEGDYSPENMEQQVMDIVSALRNLGDEGIGAANDLEQAWGLDKFSQVVKQLDKNKKAADDAQKAMEKYQETLRKWMGEDFNLGGTGFEYEISKVYADYNTKISSVHEKYLSAVEEAQEAHKGNAEAIAEETAKLAALRDAEISYIRANSQESINKLAESYLKDQYFLRGISMDNLGDMTLGQLRNLRKEMNEISKAAERMGIDFSGTKGFLASLGMDIETLTEDDLESLKEKLPETAIETIKFMKAMNDTGLSVDVLQEKIQSAIKKGLRNLDEQEKKAISRFAKYAANQILELADSLNELGEAMGNVNMQEAANSISAIGDFAKSAAQGFSQAGPLGAVIGAIASIGKSVLSDITEQQKKSAEIAQSLKDAAKAYEEAADEMAIASHSNVFGVDSLGQFREYVRIMEKYKKTVSDFYDMLRDNGGLGDYIIFAYSDGNGNFNLEKLKADIEAGVITGADDIADAIEKYKDALKEMDDVIESIFGDIASSAADKIVDSWIEAGNAALDYADILDDVARAYSKMLVQSMIMGDILDPITDDLKNAFNEERYEDAMSIVAGAMQSIEDSAPIYEQILRAFEPYFKHSEDIGSSGVGAGIKSITEDTANLLASYINAIRADVSIMRGLQERGWGYVESFGASLPTLNDYIAQIAATNFDIAQSNQSILSEIQSVIGAPGTSGMVVRVEAS